MSIKGLLLTPHRSAKPVQPGEKRTPSPVTPTMAQNFHKICLSAYQSLSLHGQYVAWTDFDSRL